MSTRRGRSVLATAPALLLLAACSDDSPSVLRPRSEAAERVEGLWWLTFWTSVFVCVLVAAFLVQAVRRGRAVGAEEGIDKRPVAWGPRFIVIAGREPRCDRSR